MSWHELVFSEKRKHKFLRHGLFWSVWAIYFSASYYHYQQVGLQQIQFETVNASYIIKLFVQLCIQIITCYYFIDFVIPDFIKKRKLSFLVLHLVFAAMIISPCFIVPSNSIILAEGPSPCSSLISKIIPLT